MPFQVGEPRTTEDLSVQVILEFRPEGGAGKLPGRRNGYYKGPRPRVVEEGEQGESNSRELERGPCRPS